MEHIWDFGCSHNIVLDINSLSKNGLHTNKKIFPRHSTKASEYQSFVTKRCEPATLYSNPQFTLTHSEHSSKHGTKWKLFRATAPMPFIWTSKRIFHIHDGLLTFSQASHINMKIGIAKGERLLKWNHFDRSFYITNHAQLLYKAHFILCTLVIFFHFQILAIFAPATNSTVPNWHKPSNDLAEGGKIDQFLEFFGYGPFIYIYKATRYFILWKDQCEQDSNVQST